MTPRRLNPRPRRELPRAIVRACGPGRRRRDEAGATLVEFALILPVFAVMLFGMIQFGLAFTGWDQLRNAVQNSARSVSSGGAVCSGASSTADCESAISTNIGTSVGTNGLPTVALYYNAVPTNGPIQLFVCASVQVANITGFFRTMALSSVSGFAISQTPNPALQPQPEPANCPPPIQHVAIPQTAGCTYNGSPARLQCPSLTWLDGYYIWEGSWLEIPDDISEAQAFYPNRGPHGPWTCGAVTSGSCTELTTNVSGISNYLNPNAVPADGALRTVG